MSLMNDAANCKLLHTDPAESELCSSRTFRFLPRELTVKCRKLIGNYHAIYGYVDLPDMFWHSDARDIIERQRDLAQIFRRASKSKRAKRANDAFLHIATMIVAIEVLARDFAGWGKRCPAAKREADKILGNPPRQRVWLMDLYLNPPLGVRRGFANALAPPAPRRFGR